MSASSSLEMLFGRLTGVYRVAAGHALTAAAPVGTTVLSVAETADFNESGGQVMVSGVVYDYTDADPEAKTLTLATPLTVAAVEDDPVDVFDPEVGGTIVVGYEADVVLDDQDSTDRPIQVDVPHGLVQMLQESTRGGAAETVTLVRDGDHDWMIWQIDGKLAVDVALEEAKAELGESLQDAYDRADEAAAAAADAALNATTALQAANGKNKVTYSLNPPGTTANTAGDIWFQKHSPTQTIIGQWEGLGGTSWSAKTLRNEVIANLDAGKLTAGSAFTNALWVKTNLTLGDAATNGVIQSHDFANQPVGVFIDKFGLVAKGGSIAGAQVTGGKVTSTSGTSEITLEGGQLRFGGNAYMMEALPYDLFISGGAGQIGFSSLGIDIGGAVSFSGNVEADGTISAPAGEVSAATLLTSDPPTAGATDGFAVRLGSSGRINKVTSSRRYKANEEAAELDAEALLGLTPKRFVRIATGRSELGFIAEDAEALGLNDWVLYNEDGEVESFAYDGWSIALQAIVRHQAAQIADLTARIEALAAAQ